MSRSCRTPCLCLFILLPILPEVVRAQAQDSVQAPPAKVEVVASPQDYDSRRDDTTTKIVVTQEEIRRHGDTTLADVLKRQPGISVVGGATGRGGEIRMRGLGSGYTRILLNGESVADGFSIDTLTPDLVERIEIQRAVTADISAQAVAGTINIVLKRRINNNQRELKLRAEYSSVFFSPSATWQVSSKGERTSYALGAELRQGSFDQRTDRQEQGFNAAGEAVFARAGVRDGWGRFRLLTLTPRVNVKLDNGDTLVWQSQVQLQRARLRNDTAWSSDFGTPAVHAFDAERARDTAASLRTDLSWTRAMEQGKRLETKLGITASRERTHRTDLGSDLAARPLLDMVTDKADDDVGVSWTGKFSIPYENGHQFSSGWDGAILATEAAQDLLLVTPADGGARHDILRYHDTFSRLALYAQDEWQWTQALSVYFGIRAEALHTRGRGRDIPAFRNTGQVISPIFQGKWTLPNRKSDQVRMALTRTYRDVPTTSLVPRLWYAVNNTQVTPDRTGNPLLKRELAWGLDAAYEHAGSKGEQLNFSTYIRRLQDVIHDQTRLVDGRWLAMPVNDGSAFMRGIEFDARFPLSLLVNSGKDVMLRVNATRNWSSVRNVPGPHNRLAGQTPVTANVGLDYTHSARLSGGASFTYRGGGEQRISITNSRYNTVKRDLDLYLLWKVRPRMQLRLTGANLLAEPATDIVRYQDAQGSLRATSVFQFSSVVRVALEMQL